MGSYRGPTLGGAVALALALAGLAVSLTDWKSDWVAIGLFIAAGAVVLFALAWALGRWAWRRLVEALRQAVAPTSPSSGAPGAMDRLRAQRTAELEFEEKRKLRSAINELGEELEYCHARIDEDQKHYWMGYDLPADKWKEHGSLLARTSDDAHRALRAAYREVDRINHCINEQTEAYVQATHARQVTVANCRPQDFNSAFHNAQVQLHSLAAELDRPGPEQDAP